VPNSRSSRPGSISSTSELPNHLPPPSTSSGLHASHEVSEIHRLLVESVLDYAIFALDTAGNIVTWNLGAERLKGYSPTDAIGRHFSMFYPDVDLAWDKPAFELREADRVGRFEDEGWRVRKDGTRFWANVVITALRDESGTLVGYAKVTRDLTERRQAELDVREREERLRSLIESVRDYGIIMLDPSGIIRSWNDGAERIYGYLAEEVMGQHFADFYTPDDLADRKPARELETALANGRVEDEGWRVRKDGSLFWANVSIASLRNRDGTLLGFTKVTRDLTERRAGEQRALAAAQRIAAEEAARRAADERARELADLLDRVRSQAAEIEQQRREAETANRAKAEFLAAMSHELRTPLNAISGYAEILSLGIHGPVSDAQQRSLDRIRDSQKYLLGIINDILNFSRIEAGKVSYDIGPVVVWHAVEAVAPMVVLQANDRGVAFEYPPPERAVTALADASKLEQILVNLLTNAVKFTNLGGRIRVECREAGDTVEIIVADTGLGIPEDKLQAIFEPFVQVGRSLAQPREGAGLGLAISRDLARAMSGDLTATSIEGSGSTFTLSLPNAHRAES
jgi:PAS domain S-box-containing protein